MKHLIYLLIDMLVAVKEALQIVYRSVTFKSKPQPSLLARNIAWCTDSAWLERLKAYQQLSLSTHNK